MLLAATEDGRTGADITNSAGGGYNYTGLRFDFINGYPAHTNNTLSAAVNTSNAYNPYFEIFVNDPVYGPIYWNYEYLETSSDVTAKPLGNGYTQYTYSGISDGIPSSDTLNVCYLGDFTEAGYYSYTATNLSVDGVAVLPNLHSGLVFDETIDY